MYEFEAGKGVNKNKLNSNFAELQTGMNTNETKLTQIANTALLKDGSNLTQGIIDKFNRDDVIVLSGSGDINLTDNKSHFLTLSDNGNIILPKIPSDSMSHTIELIVSGSPYSLSLGTNKHVLNYMNLIPTETYSVMYIYNKIDNEWYYSLTQ